MDGGAARKDGGELDTMGVSFCLQCTGRVAAPTGLKEPFGIRLPVLCVPEGMCRNYTLWIDVEIEN